MKRIYLIAAGVLILSALILTYSQTPRQRTQPAQTVGTADLITMERQVRTQQRINRYFHDDVMSRIRGCWSNVQGKGTISMKHIYSKSGTRWVFTGVDVEKSSLSADTTKVALRCMSDSTRGSSFLVDPIDSGVDTFVLKWTWPVPFPTNETQLTRAMFAASPSGSGDSGGGCDGRGTQPKCYVCKKTPGPDLDCATVCVGKDTCTITNLPGGQKNCGASQTACASGGPFGVFGGSRVIY